MPSLVTPNPFTTLTPIEKTGPKGWLRYIYPFELSQDYDIAHITRVFQLGYSRAKQRLPILGCEAVPDPSFPGLLRLEEHNDDGLDSLIVKDLRSTFPHTFAELKDQHFPVKSLCPDTLSRKYGVWPTAAGERFAVTLVQLNFIPGGVLVNFSVFHSYADGNTCYMWTRIWAEECRRVQGEAVAQIELEQPEILTDRRHALKSKAGATARWEDHPEYVKLPFVPQSAPPKLYERNHSSQIFYFSPEALERLKAECSPANATAKSADHPKWISTNDALTALMWQTVMKAQHGDSLDALSPDQKSVMAVSVDTRKRTSPPVHEHTMGNFYAVVNAEMDMRSLLTTASLADVAITVRAAVNKADESYFDRLCTLVEDLDHMGKMAPAAFLDLPGPNATQTTWVDYPLTKLEWGSEIGRMKAVRHPENGVLHGLQIVLPRLECGGLEVSVGAVGDALDRVRGDEVWRRFAVAR